MIRVERNGLGAGGEYRTPIRIFLVDDSAMFLSTARTFLSDFPFLRIEGSACSGQEALEKASTLDVDLVLMDFLMPGMDGEGAARLMKAAHPSRKIVIMSIHSHLAKWFAEESSLVDGFVDKSEFGSTIIPLIRQLFQLSGN